MSMTIDDVEFVDFERAQDAQKIVQLYVEGHPVIIFSDQERYHAQILEDYLREKSIPYTTVQAYSDRRPIPSPCGERYRAVGMGHAAVLQDLKFFSAHGDSLDYNIGIDEEHLARVRAALRAIGWH